MGLAGSGAVGKTRWGGIVRRGAVRFGERGVFVWERLGVEMIRFGNRIGVNSCLSLIVLGVVFVLKNLGNEWYSGVSEFT